MKGLHEYIAEIYHTYFNFTPSTKSIGVVWGQIQKFYSEKLASNTNININ